MQKNILIIEDSDDDFEITETALMDSEFENKIIRCKDGNEALNYISDKTISDLALIILDLNMPGLDGRFVLKQLKSNDEYKKVPVVILTTSVDRRDVDQCYGYGANTYIQKSFDYRKFQSAMQTLEKYWFSVATI
ncbi:MAG: response regulator [Pseudomonadota bacterium]